MKTIDELVISKTPWKSKGSFVVSKDFRTVALAPYNEARLIAATPELLVFAVAYYKANKKNAVKINPNNGDKFQSGLMLMCKEALVKAGIMDKSEVWQEEVK